MESFCYIMKKNADAFYKDVDDWVGAYINDRSFDYSVYQDIDTKESGSKRFYIDLTEFLNSQEKNMEGKLYEKYFYTFNENEPYGIEVRKVIGAEMSEPIFYLKSDQFGFSAPSKKQNHPYDTYISDMEGIDVDKAYRNVAEWIYKTRSLGGSFLWPMEFVNGKWLENPSYNCARGGTAYYAPRYYIEDRVDLTLLEIKEVLDAIERKNLCDNILWSKCIENSSNMLKWLMHFKNFKTYVEFFCFDSFVNQETLMPFDITQDSTSLLEKDKKIRKIYTKDKHMPCEEMEDMFNRVEKNIEKRTKSMMEIILRSKEKNG